jgi:small-conductance mechanosensitive channel
MQKVDHIVRAAPRPRACPIFAGLGAAIAAILLLRPFVGPHPVVAQAAATDSVVGSPSASASPISGGTPEARTKTQIPPEKMAHGADDTRHSIISYLGQVISWNRQIEVEERLATEPAETLFVADDRRMAAEIVKLAFEYARAEAALLSAGAEGIGAASATGTAQVGAGNQPAAAFVTGGQQPLAGLPELTGRLDQAKAELEQAKARLQEIRGRLTSASRSDREALNRQAFAVQGEIDLAQSRVNSIAAMIEFETGSTASGGRAGLDAQIDEFERSIPQVSENEKVRVPATLISSGPYEPSGMLGRIEGLLALKRKEQTLSNELGLTNALLVSAETMRSPLIQAQRDIDRQGRALTAQAESSDLATIKQSKAEVEKLTGRQKLVVSALLPLSKQIVILKQYSVSLTRWRQMVHQRFGEDLRGLIVRLLGLVMLLGAVFAGATIWRQLTFRYVEDLQRRHQLLQLRRLTVTAVVALVLIFYFANELGALVTVLGFAAAGIALALQNVILSIAGYFYVSGRYGIKAGDRVEVAGINGDVLEIGLFKMTLMELSADQYARQPTGRVVVFPNSVLFQPNANFFKQLPGTNFTWQELRLTLAPDCDYRLAEKRLIEVVNEVFAHYRDAIQREYRGMEQALNIRVDAPRPHSRLRLGATGIEMVIRYPAQLQKAAQTSDEIARRLVDAIKRDPGLRLVAEGTPSIQPALEPKPAEASNEAAGPSDGA